MTQAISWKKDETKYILELYCESQSTLYLARNLTFHSRTKHIDFCFHFVYDVVDNGRISLLKIHIDTNLVDMLTKPVIQEKFNYSKTLNLELCDKQ